MLSVSGSSDANATYESSNEVYDEVESTEAPGTDEHTEDLEQYIDDYDIDDDEWIVGPTVCNSSSSSESRTEAGTTESQCVTEQATEKDEVEEVGDDERGEESLVKRTPRRRRRRRRLVTAGVWSPLTYGFESGRTFC